MLIAAMLLQASTAAPAPAFAPPADTVLRVVSERIDTGAEPRRYRMERLVRFAREAGGYRAEVQMQAADGEGAAGSMFETGFAALAGQRIVIHLDASGAVIAIDDMAALWARLCASVTQQTVVRLAKPGADRTALAQRIAAPLAAMPAERQRELLGTLVTSLIAGEAVETPGSVAPVLLPGASPLGGQVMLDGTRRTARVDGAIETRTEVAADIGDAGPAAGRVTLERVRRIDPATGLITLSTDTLTTRQGATETRRVTTLRVESAPAVARVTP